MLQGAIHRMEFGDSARLQRLHERCLDYSLLADGEPASPSVAADSFADVPPGHSPDCIDIYGLVTPAGEIAGVLQLLRGYPDSSAWWIGLLLIDPDSRGHGAGKRLLEHVLSLAMETNISQLQLGVLDENPAARRFWEREGFLWLRSTEPRPFGKKMHVVHVLRRLL